MKRITYAVLLLLSVFSFTLTGQTPNPVETLSPMQQARVNHVQIAVSPTQYIVIGGHINDFKLTKQAEIYNTETNEWSVAGSVDNRDMSFVAKLNDGRYLIGGGCSYGSGVGQLKTTEIFSPSNLSFTASANMNIERTNVRAATLADGRVLVVGNWYASASYAEVYDPQKNVFVKTGACVVERAYPVIIPTNDRGAIVLGGFGTRGETLNLTAEKYDAQSNSFTRIETDLFDTSTKTWQFYWTYEYITEQFRLPDNQFVIIGLAKDIKTQLYEVKLVLIDPLTGKMSMMETSEPIIPYFDNNGTAVGLHVMLAPIIDKKNNVLHVMLSGSVNGENKMWLVTVNLETKKVNKSEVGIFEPNHIPTTGKVSMMDNGSFLLTGGMKPNNFTMSKMAYIITPKIYETSVKTPVIPSVSAYWDTATQAFVLSENVKTAALYDVNGRVVNKIENGNKIDVPPGADGIYIIRAITRRNGAETLKVVKSKGL